MEILPKPNRQNSARESSQQLQQSNSQELLLAENEKRRPKLHYFLQQKATSDH